MPTSSGTAWTLAVVSLYYPAFYMAASWWVTLKHRRLEQRPAQVGASRRALTGLPDLSESR